MSSDSSSLILGTRHVGPEQPCLIVAEVGVNHDGCMRIAMELIEAARSAGADAVKFQWFSAGELVTDGAETVAYQKEQTGITSQRRMLQDLELGEAEFAALCDHCRALGLYFLATPFSEQALARLVRLQPAAVKLASTDLNNVFLQRAAAATGLPIIVSTGAAMEDEIVRSIHRLRTWNSLERTVWMHCVSAYPTPWDHANLRAIRSLEVLTRRPVGFSDHTGSVETGALACAAGACVLEKHLTHDRRACGPDHQISLEPDAFKVYVQRVREAEAALGTGMLGFQEIESETRLLARRSLVAAKPIEPQETITLDKLTAKRPSGGIDPEAFEAVVGRRARKAISRDEPICWELLV